VRRAIVVSVSLIVAVGCGAEGGRPSFAPSVPAEKPPRTVDEALQRIDRARSEIDANKAAGAAPPAPDSPPAQPTGEPKPTATDAPSAGYSPCSGPCRALGSMRRAVEALCELTGAADDRCTTAQKTLQESRAKVGPCSCE